MASTATSRPFVETQPLHALAEPTVLALAFDSLEVAGQALLAARALEADGQLVLHDAVLLEGVDQGPAEVVSTLDPVPVAAAVPGSLFGALVGTLAAGPVGLLLGGALGGGTAVLLGKLADTGIPGEVLDRLRADVAAGQFTCVLLVSDKQPGASVGFAMRCGTVGKSTIVPV